MKRFTDPWRRKLLAEAEENGFVQTARKHKLSDVAIYSWRKKFRRADEAQRAGDAEEPRKGVEPRKINGAVYQIAKIVDRDLHAKIRGGAILTKLERKVLALTDEILNP